MRYILNPISTHFVIFELSILINHLLIYNTYIKDVIIWGTNSENFRH